MTNHVGNAQSKFEAKDFGSFTLHTFVTADPLGDMSYIIEGANALVVLEPAAFLENIREFDEYVSALNKPIEKVIANYHVAGAGAFNDHSTFVMIEDMPEFVKGPVYGGMMGNFAAAFGDAMDVSEFKPAQLVSKNTSVNWAGVDFRFSPGATSDFPAASILIGGQVYYQHFTPAANMHIGPLQLTGRTAVDAQLAELEHAKASGATPFIGGHGIATADKTAVDFQITYLKKMKELLARQTTAVGFISAMKAAYPNIAGEDGLNGVAAALYQ